AQERQHDVQQLRVAVVVGGLVEVAHVPGRGARPHAATSTRTAVRSSSSTRWRTYGAPRRTTVAQLARAAASSANMLLWSMNSSRLPSIGRCCPAAGSCVRSSVDLNRSSPVKSRYPARTQEPSGSVYRRNG